MQPQFNPPENGNHSVLLCPSCSSNHLHHWRVEVFERAKDEANGVHVSVEDGKPSIDTDLTGNPSERRHGLIIHFACEVCSAMSALTFAQHKGNTFVDFKYADET